MAIRKSYLTFNIAGFIVGALFIFSGLIKINDPVGTAIKLEEYFQVFTLDFGPVFQSFIPYALGLSVFLCVFEVVLGFALLLKFKLKWTVGLLFALIAFFTFLTFYSAYYNKVTDCGCFGDVLKLTPWQSFSKDIALLVLIMILIFTRKPDMDNPPKIMATFLGIFTTASLIAALYAIAHLPFKDFRAYKTSTDIAAGMKPKEACRYTYIMEKDGKEYEMEQYPTDTTYIYKSMITLNPEACQPKIIDFNIWSAEQGDKTQEVLKGTRLIIVVEKTAKAEKSAFPAINALVKEVESDSLASALVLTATDAAAYESFKSEVGLTAPYLLGDATLLKTIMRSTPGLFLLKDGTVKGKWHYNDVPSRKEIEKALGK